MCNCNKFLISMLLVFFCLYSIIGVSNAEVKIGCGFRHIVRDYEIIKINSKYNGILFVNESTTFKVSGEPFLSPTVYMQSKLKETIRLMIDVSYTQLSGNFEDVYDNSYSFAGDFDSDGVTDDTRYNMLSINSDYNLKLIPITLSGIFEITDNVSFSIGAGAQVVNIRLNTEITENDIFDYNSTGTFDNISKTIIDLKMLDETKIVPVYRIKFHMNNLIGKRISLFISGGYEYSKQNFGKVEKNITAINGDISWDINWYNTGPFITVGFLY